MKHRRIQGRSRLIAMRRQSRGAWPVQRVKARVKWAGSA